MTTIAAKTAWPCGGALLAGICVLGSSAAVAADTQPQANIVVEAARPQAPDQPNVPGRLVRVELRGEVSYADLDLTIDSNAKVLKERVQEAARSICSNLDRMYHLHESAKACASRAERDAMPQVEAAVAAAQDRKDAAR